MTIRSILVAVRGDGHGEVVMNHALALARQCNAHIDVMHARARPEDLIPYGVLMTDAMRKTILESAAGNAEQEEGRVRDLFSEYCKKNGLETVDSVEGANADRVTVSWHEVTGKQADLIGVWGRLADLICVAKPTKDLGQNTLEAALMQTGTPTVLCAKTAPDVIGKHPVIAWNGSAEASSTVKAVLDLLTAADKVTILSADPAKESHDLAAEDLQRFLSKHGVTTDIRLFGKSDNIGSRLLDETKAAGGDLLVMGAYGRSRRRELVFGGATEHVVRNAALPVLLGH